MEEKLCINCKHKSGDMCDHPFNRSKVDGEPDSSCRFYRNSLYGCGDKGIYWEPKVSILQTIKNLFK